MGTQSHCNSRQAARAWASANSSPRSANSWRAMMVLRSRTRHCSAGDSCTAGIGSGWKAVRACALSRNACAAWPPALPQRWLLGLPTNRVLKRAGIARVATVCDACASSSITFHRYQCLMPN